MTTHPYANETDFYALQSGYSLQRAANAEFVNYWVIYRNYNEDFSQSFAEQRRELEGVPF